nr:MAG: hypothetical protein 2 [Leviviridae sp.]
MLTDPQSVTINAVATSLPKTLNGSTANEYTSADGVTKMTVKQNVTASRFRREVRLSQHKVAADPITGLNKDLGVSVYLVIDEPKSGYSDAEIGYLIDALKTWASSANYNKILGGEL